MMGGGGVVAVLGVVDSGLYGGGMASLYHLVADLKSMDIRGQHTQQEEMHTDMKIHTLTSTLERKECSLDDLFFVGRLEIYKN